MTETQAPHKHDKLSKKHIAIAVTLCVLTVASAPTLFGPFALVPIAFAYPIIIGKQKLLRIPAGMLGVCFIMLLLMFREFGLPLIMLIVFGTVSVFGIGAGVLIRRYHASRKRVKILTTTVGIIILLMPFLFVLEFIIAPIRTPFVHFRVCTYVARYYSDFDLTVNRPTLNFLNNQFTSQIHERNNPDIYFRITHTRGKLRDGFTSGSFWAGTLNYMLSPLLEEKFGEEFYSFIPQVAGVQVGQPFDKTADVDKTARIIVTTESAAPEALSALLSRYHEFFSQHGFNFTQYTFRIHYENAPPIRGGERAIDITIQNRLINDEIPAMIEYARNNRNHNGVYHTDYFRYVSRVGYWPAG